MFYNKIRPYLKKVARPDFVCSADMYPLEVDSEKISRISYIIFCYPKTLLTMRKGFKQAGMPKVNRKQLFGYSFNLPTLEEQKSTTEYLDSIAGKSLLAAKYFADSAILSHPPRDSILRKHLPGNCKPDMDEDEEEDLDNPYRINYSPRSAESLIVRDIRKTILLVRKIFRSRLLILKKP